jgi:probable rRNA maturation factor
MASARKPQVSIHQVGRLAGVKSETWQRLAAETAALARRRQPFCLGLVAVGEKEMRRLNRTYRGKDRVTDVLSFRLADGAPQPGAAAGELENLGDIFICMPQVRRQAKAVPRAVRTEVALMVAHGTLHLLGYDHVTLAEETRMFSLQHEALARQGYI